MLQTAKGASESNKDSQSSMTLITGKYGLCLCEQFGVAIHYCI